MKKAFTSIISIICIVGIIYSSYNIIRWKINIDENNKIQKEINEKITINEVTDDNEEEYKIDFSALKNINPDTIAYLKVNNTNIDYIVVKSADNSYYLNHNFQKNWNTAGWIFGDYHNRYDGTDKNLVIFGHDMKDGSMFGTLKNILNKEWYENLDNHQIIFVTEQGTFKYQVFSTYSIVPEDYYINTEFHSTEEFNNFIKTIKSRSIYDYKTEVTAEDKILTLSGCLGDSSRRVVLHAKLINTNK